MTLASTPEVSVAATLAAPVIVAVPVGAVSRASAPEATMFEASTKAAAEPVAPNSAEAAELAAFDRVAFNCAVLSARIDRSPATVSAVPLTSATARAGLAVPSDVPKSASTVCDRMFVGT